MASIIAKARWPWSQTCMKRRGIQLSNRRNINVNTIFTSSKVIF